MRRRLKRFFKTPKGLLTLILATLILLAAPAEGSRAVAVRLAASVAAATAVDVVILRRRSGGWRFPSGAILSAAIVVMVLRSQEPWYVDAVTSVAAVLSKYPFRVRGANVFNPAALAMVAAYYLFHAGESWWGAQTGDSGLARLFLVAAGVFIANRVNRLPLVLVFLGSYFALFTITAFGRDALAVAEIFRTPDFEAVLYFALIILTDPPTSPANYRDQIVCGLIAAMVSYLCFSLAGVVYFLLAGALAGNLWQAWRRSRRLAASPA